MAVAHTGRKPVFRQRMSALRIGQSFTTAVTTNANSSRTQAHACAKRLGFKIQTTAEGNELRITRIA